MGFNGFAKKHASILRGGILPAIILFMALYLLNSILGSVFAIGLKIFNFSSNVINYTAIVVVLLIYIYLVALLLKSLYLKLLKNKYPEIMFRVCPDSGVWMRGFVTGKHYEEIIKRDLYKVVYSAHFNPFCFTVEIEPDKVYFTGRNAMENVVFNFSGGICEETKDKPPE